MSITAQQIIDKRKKLWKDTNSIKQDEKYINQVVEYIARDKDLRNEIILHPEYIVEMCFVLVNKDQETIPFFFNNVQKLFLNDLIQAIDDYNNKKRLHLKFLVLKGRQQGFTQAITAYQLANAIVKHNFSGITIADKGENATTIFQKKAKYQFEHIPEALKPSTKFNNRKEFLFDKINSSWYVSSAENGEVGRSNTINFFHGSEVAFWTSISDIITGLGEALTKNAIQVLESTANGYNEFKDLWDNAGENTWEAKFYQWWLTDEYSTEFESDYVREQFVTNVTNGYSTILSENELFKKLKGLRNNYHLDYTQLYWYYNKWKGYIDKQKIKQEYPCSPSEAFLSSGRCVFDKDIIASRIDCLTEQYKAIQPKRGYFTFKWNNADVKDYILDDSIEFVEDSKGYIKIYEDIKEGYPYVIGGDTSSGVGVSDFFAGTVINNATGVRSATLHSRLDPDMYTHQMYCLGMYFNKALIAIEVNFDGFHVTELQRLKYPNQYKRQQYDSIRKEKLRKYGFKTDGNTRPLIISKEVTLIRDNVDLFNDITMLNECLTFVYDKNNRPDAEVGKHDDLLMSDMIANEARCQQTFTVITKEVIELNTRWYSDDEIDDMVASKQITKYQANQYKKQGHKPWNS